MEKKYSQLLKDTLIFAIGNIGSKMILFLLVPLYTNCLSPGEYGVADLVFSLGLFAVPIVSFVIYHAILRFGLSKHENSEDVLLCGLLVSVVGSLVTLALTPLVGLYESIGQWKWYFSIYVILHLFINVFQSYLKAIGKNKAYALISIIYTFALAMLNIAFLAWQNMGIEGYLLANVVATAFAVLLYMFAGKIFTIFRRANFDYKLLKRMLVYSAPLVVDSVLWWLIQSSNKVFVEFILGEEVLGFYTVAVKIPALMYVVVTIFSQAWGISAVKEVENSNDNLFYKNIFSVYSTLTCGACVFLVTIIKPFMKIYVGAEFFDAWIYVPMLLSGTAFLALSDFFGAFYNAHKKTLRNMIVSSFSAAVSIAISLLFLHKIGLWAAIVGTFFAYFLILIVRLIDTRKYVKIDLDIKRLLANSIILITQAVLVSLDIQIYLVSAVALLLFVLVNFKMIKAILQKIKNTLFKKNHAK